MITPKMILFSVLSILAVIVSTFWAVHAAPLMVTEGSRNTKLCLKIHGQVQPLLTNPSTQTTGINFDTFEPIKNIPDARLSLLSQSSSICIDNPMDGLYQLQVKGPVEDDFRLELDFYDNIGEKRTKVSLKQHFYDAIVNVSFMVASGTETPVAFITDVEPPSELVASNNGGNVSLSWLPSSTAGIDHYNVYMRTESQQIFQLQTETAATSIDTSDAWCMDDSCIVRYYRVTAIKGPGESAYSNAVNNKYKMRAEFTADVTSGKSPLTVHFSDASQCEITSWEWDFDNDGEIDSSDQHPTYIHTYIMMRVNIPLC